MDPNSLPDFYSTRLFEGIWGILLVAITLGVHGFGMVFALLACERLKERLQRHEFFGSGISVIILASWMIIVVHLLEVGIWAHFFLWKQAVAGAHNNISLCYYFALMDYTTLGSSYNLKLDWRLLEGMIGIAGLLTFAWSTGILMTLAQEFQERDLGIVKARLRRRASNPTSTPGDAAKPAP
jgi:hypothetical protein